MNLEDIMSKKKFDFYSFQFNPLTDISLDYDEKSGDAMMYKNEYFEQILNDNLRFNQNKLDLKYEIVYKDKRYTLIKIAKQKYIKREINFKEERVLTEPSSAILIDNDPNVQRMYIESDRNSFSHSGVLKDIVEQSFSTRLKKHGLGISINTEFAEEEFWKLIKGKENEIQAIRFKFSYYNLGRAHRKLTEELKEMNNSLNSSQNNIEFKAEQGDTLNNLNKENELLNEFIHASSVGQGDTEVRERGKVHWKSTKRKNKFSEVDVLIPSDLSEEKFKIILNEINRFHEEE